MRTCIRCQQTQPVHHFKDRPDKKPYPYKTNVCRECERDRGRDTCPSCGGMKWRLSKKCFACDRVGRGHRIKNPDLPSVPCPQCGRQMQRKSQRCFDCGRRNRDAWTKVKTGPKRGPVVDRFISKTIPGRTHDHCILWNGTVGRSDYGYFVSGRHHGLAHRWSYRLFVGDIPKGMTVDHLCRDHRCVNPFHLELCTLSENSRRAAASRDQERRLWRHVREHYPHIFREIPLEVAPWPTETKKSPTSPRRANVHH